MSIKKCAFDEMHEHMTRVLRASHALQMATAGYMHCDIGDDAARGAFQMIADEIEDGINLAMATWKRADDEAAAV